MLARSLARCSLAAPPARSLDRQPQPPQQQQQGPELLLLWQQKQQQQLMLWKQQQKQQGPQLLLLWLLRQGLLLRLSLDAGLAAAQLAPRLFKVTY